MEEDYSNKLLISASHHWSIRHNCLFHPENISMWENGIAIPRCCLDNTHTTKVFQALIG